MIINSKTGAELHEARVDRILDRFVEAVITGAHCGTSDDNGPRRYAALSLGGLGILTRHDLWREAMRRIVGTAAHREAQRRFLDAWCRVPMTSMVRRWVGDDDLFFAGLRVLLPAYNGPAMDLFRGQLASEPVGPAWTRSYDIALKFALYGCENVNPHRLHAARIPPRSGAVMMRTTAHVEIICAPCLLGHAEGEYVVDPRSLKPAVWPVP